jgi:hypothetical protein
MAKAMPLFRTPTITKNVFTMLHPSPTFKIFSTRTSHSTHYESQESTLCVIQVFHAIRSQSLLTLPCMVQKNHFLLPLNAIILKSMRPKKLIFF